MLQLNTATISTAEDFVLGIDTFKIIESPGRIIFYDAERDAGFSITGDFDNKAIKNDLFQSFNEQYEREGALDLRINDISKHIWEHRSDNIGDVYYGIYRLEGAYLNIPGNQNDVWITNPDEKYASGLDETLTHTFGDAAVKFGIMYPLSDPPSKINPDTAIVFGRLDGSKLTINVKGDIDTAKALVDNTIKHFDKKQDYSIVDINNYLKSQIMELQQKDFWIKDEYEEDILKHTFGNKTYKFEATEGEITDHNDPNYKGYKQATIVLREPNGLKSVVSVKGDLNTAKMLVENTIKHFGTEQEPTLYDMEKYIKLQISQEQAREANAEKELKNPSSYQVQLSQELAKKAGYVQGVCECVAAIGDDHTLGKKLLSEMNVTKDMAKKFANPETFKALEQGIFAQQQKIEQTHSIKR